MTLPTVVAPVLVSVLPGAPLDPSPDQARDLLSRELARPDYVEDDVLQRVLDWIGRQLEGGLEGARDTAPLTWLAITVVTLALLAAVTALATRARGTARAARERGGVLSEESVTASALRAQAESALVAGRYAEAVVEGFRALARRQVERGLLDDDPGITAREVAGLLARARPIPSEASDDLRARAIAAADLFDAVRYGDRPATREQAAAVLDLDGDLAGRR